MPFAGPPEVEESPIISTFQTRPASAQYAKVSTISFALQVFNVKTFSSAQQFLANQRPKTASCLVLDLQLSGLSGLDLQKELVKAGIQIPIIFVTGHWDIRRRCAP